ncbi:MAG: glycerophosphodiester phosphodiesterase [Gemmatimonadota bacterium]|nr:glycerophosphodiester phosphodiesterase [Gemmatimonadota bacterium]
MANHHRRPERIGHRGAPLEFPENTLPGFLRAVDRGADAVELDVHRTRDGAVVVHHDPDLLGLDGARTPIARLTLADVQGWPLADAAHVPTLADVMRALRDDAAVYVELKGEGVGEAAVEVAVEEGHGFAFHGFDHDAVLALRDRYPELNYGVLFDAGTRDVVARISDLPVRDLWPHHSLVNRELVEAAHAAGRRVIAWTVNAPEEARRLTLLEVDGLCGDDVRIFG